MLLKKKAALYIIGNSPVFFGLSLNDRGILLPAGSDVNSPGCISGVFQTLTEKGKA